MYVFTKTELNQKVNKHSQKTFNMGRLHREKVPMLKTWGLKRGGGCLLVFMCLLQRGIFSGAYGTHSFHTYHNWLVKRKRMC